MKLRQGRHRREPCVHSRLNSEVTRGVKLIAEGERWEGTFGRSATGTKSLEGSECAWMPANRTMKQTRTARAVTFPPLRGAAIRKRLLVLSSSVSNRDVALLLGKYQRERLSDLVLVLTLFFGYYRTR